VSFLRIIQILTVAFVAAIVLSVWTPNLFRSPSAGTAASNRVSPVVRGHVLDRAGVIPPQDLPRFEQYMGWIMRESGVDVRFVFLSEIGGQSIETLAADLMDQLQK